MSTNKVYNFTTEAYQEGLPANDEEAMQCLPEHARDYYDLRRHMGDSVLDAWEKVLQTIADIHMVEGI